MLPTGGYESSPVLGAARPAQGGGYISSRPSFDEGPDSQRPQRTISTPGAIATGVTWLLYPSERAWAQRVRELLLADVLAGVLYLPWASSLLTQVATVGEHLWWVPRPTVSTPFGTLSVIAGFDTEYLSWLPGRLLPLSSQTAWVCVVAGVSFMCAALVAGGLWRVSKADRSRNLSLLLYCVLPVLVVFMLSQKMQPLCMDKIFTTSSAVVPIVFAYPLERLFSYLRDRLALQSSTEGGRSEERGLDVH